MKSLIVLIAFLVPACGTVQLHAEKSVEWQRRPGSTCFVRLIIDGGEKTVEVDGPNACLPPTTFCEAP